MSILNLVNASFNIGEQVLLDHVNLIVEKGQKVCLVGRNGAGKSTLLKVLGSELELDGGQVVSQSGVRIARLEQDLPGQTELDTYSVIASAFSDVGDSLSEFRQLSLQTDPDLTRMSEVQIAIEKHDGWTAMQKIEAIISRLDLNPEAKLSSLSGGWRRRVLLAKALVIEPQLLLLDEPTNHLDIAAIEWLEELLSQFSEALIMVSHDRALLSKVGTHFLTLDRGELVPFAGNYDSYLESEAKRLAQEEQDNALADKKLAQEEAWIRQGVKARRTRNEGRVRRLEALREQRGARRQRQGEANLVIDQGVQAGKRVFESENLHLVRGEKQLIDNLDLVIQRGDRIGLVGPNGIGKSSFMQLFSGGLEPTSGKLKLGTKLSIAYFDQQRQQLDLNLSALDNVAGGRDFIDINGKALHAISYLGEFMFSGTRARTKVEKLSGGERNRLLLAKLFSHPSNLLLLDEPTNDLDIETLEMLESRLMDFEGTVIVASHDRSFLDNVATSLLLFEGDGKITEHIGTYDQWLDYKGSRSAKLANKASPEKKQQPVGKASASKKLSYQLKRELEQLPEKIAELEQAIDGLQVIMSQPDFYQGDQKEVAEKTSQLTQAQVELDLLYKRWEELDE